MDQNQKTSERPQSVTVSDNEGGSTFDARRRVIRGAIGLPAVVTLASGRAASAASILNCALNEESQPSDADIDVIPYDNTDPSQRDGFAPNVFDTGEGTAVRYQSTGQWVPVDPDGEGPADAVPVVASCYTSFVGTGDV
jgi:hypothetical protein